MHTTPSSSIDTFGWALNGVQSKNKYSSPFHSINLLVGEKAGSCMYSNEGSKTYQMQSGRDEQVAGRDGAQSRAEDGTRNCTFRLWQQESETGGDDGLEKRTWSAMSQSMQQH